MVKYHKGNLRKNEEYLRVIKKEIGCSLSLLKLYKVFLLFCFMAVKVIDATEMRAGTFLLLDGVAHQVKKFDISKTGKHGHAKVRFEAINILSGKKRLWLFRGMIGLRFL